MSVTETKSAVWSARDWAQAILPYRRASAASRSLRAHGDLPAICRGLDRDDDRLRVMASSGFRSRWRRSPPGCSFACS